MTVDFLHNQIIKDTITPAFIKSFNEDMLDRLSLRYGSSLEAIQFYDNHIKDGFRIGGIFYYPLTVVISGVAKTEWICWQVSNYRIYDNFNPFSYKGKEPLEFSYATELPDGLLEKMMGRPIYATESAMPISMNAATDDKTFLAGKYSQGFIDLMASEITAAIENELLISGLSDSGVELEMCFAPGTYMEHIAECSTYRRLRIKARACSARDLWIRWTRLDGMGTYTVSDNVDRSMIRFELAENVPGKIKEKEYRYLASDSPDKYRESMGRKNITEWREMMRRVLRRGEVEKYERITISKRIEKDEPTFSPVEQKVTVSAVKISTEPVRERDEITERLNALLGKSDVEFSREPETLAESINADLNELLRGALGAAAPKAGQAPEEPIEESIEEEIEEIPEEPVEEIIEEPTEEATKEINEPSSIESEIEARIRRELEEKMRAEMDELREKLEAKKRAEERERELLAEAARRAVLDTEKREADRRAEEERDRLEKERREKEEALRLERERAEEAARIEEEARAAKESEPIPEPTPRTVTKTVNLIFRRGGVDKNMIARVRDVIVATVKLMGKESVYMKVKAQTPDPTTLTLTFSELPHTEERLIVDLIQVLGKSGLGITKATLE